MKPADVHLWEKFIRANPGFFDSCDYDVPVGPAPDWMNPDSDEYAQKELPLYKKKVDVVGWRGDDAFLVEVKPLAGSSALGQLMAYALLFRKDFPDVEILRTMIVTNTCQTGYCEIFRKHIITCHHVGFCNFCKHHGNA